MAISNVEMYRNNPSMNTIVANNNVTLYNKTRDAFYELGSNDKMLTNIEDMKHKFSQLKASGAIDGEFTELQLSSSLKQAIEIQTKQQKSLEDIEQFWNTYNSFRDICVRIGG